MNIDLMPIITALIGLIAAVITRYFVPWLKEKLQGEKFDNYMQMVQTLVTAAEGIFKGPGRGEEKLRWVEDELASRGYKIDIVAIEAMVKELFNSEVEVIG